MSSNNKQQKNNEYKSTNFSQVDISAQQSYDNAKQIDYFQIQCDQYQQGQNQGPLETNIQKGQENIEQDLSQKYCDNNSQFFQDSNELNFKQLEKLKFQEQSPRLFANISDSHKKCQESPQKQEQNQNHNKYPRLGSKLIKFIVQQLKHQKNNDIFNTNKFKVFLSRSKKEKNFTKQKITKFLKREQLNDIIKNLLEGNEDSKWFRQKEINKNQEKIKIYRSWLKWLKQQFKAA